MDDIRRQKLEYDAEFADIEILDTPEKIEAHRKRVARMDAEDRKRLEAKLRKKDAAAPEGTGNQP